mmetsp:Transcript_586/g.985  ORF Transcript_586/g.985 Transcript_586/m.985 type:complete len:213 (+) Transcript_586:56-694(+)|eukprot:CAMPEP_0184337076 /NCGR_PEP_ID=MMETSP1089-20130417/5391_1 /TAXON_ID=38269 ORGANISM="Gloeochaete wittrockiana, Strain SAG46.84" /NCGR_SAMPLE_ID=MMETSP1089 /ASSEMBLY_ACC=CAM_ASM_000445 /LENGTH=212 /DNA_ID=CAMNT_0026662489 /DNA_START=56 /DNA_END=694 /DNA_ORIENTATION=-
MFTQYKLDYEAIVNGIRKNCQVLPEHVGEKKKILKQATERDFDDAEKLLRKMAVEIQSQPALRSEIDTCRKELDKARKEFTGALIAMPSSDVARSSLQYKGDPDLETGGDERQRLLASSDLLEKSDRSLRDSQRVAKETEDIGVGIISELQKQREGLINAKNKVSGIDDNLQKGGRIIRSMTRRVIANRLILYGIIAVLFLMIGVALYIRFR